MIRPERARPLMLALWSAQERQDCLREADPTASQGFDLRSIFRVARDPHLTFLCLPARAENIPK